jgi:hypothetical protein
METFCVQINEGPEQVIEVRTGLYHLAALAALALTEYPEAQQEHDIIKIWVPELLPGFGPYFYAWDGEKLGQYLPDQDMIIYTKSS